MFSQTNMYLAAGRIGKKSESTHQDLWRFHMFTLRCRSNQVFLLCSDLCPTAKNRMFAEWLSIPQWKLEKPQPRVHLLSSRVCTRVCLQMTSSVPLSLCPSTGMTTPEASGHSYKTDAKTPEIMTNTTSAWGDTSALQVQVQPLEAVTFGSRGTDCSFTPFFFSFPRF